MPAEKLGQPPPLVQSMILADAIHRDPSTKKHSILGTYNAIGSPRFPTAQNPLRLYVALTDAHGPTTLRIRVTDMDEVYGSLHESVHTVNLPDPNQAWELTFAVAAAFPSPGMYRIQLFAGHELLRELRLRVTQNPPSPGLPDDVEN
jgi:hypothetical protein